MSTPPDPIRPEASAARLTSRAVEVRSVSTRLGGALIIDDLSLVAGAGEVTVLLGPSGSGKSTLLRVLAGLERPDSGEVVIGGEVVAGPRSWVPPERRRVGMVFQDWALFPHLSVGDNVGFGVPRAERSPERTERALALVGLDGMQDRAPHTLSGGQQQRVALARALAPRPDVLLLDEPFSNLDAALRRRLRTEVHELLVSLSMTTVFVTHDQEEAFVLGDSVAIVRDGRIVQTGSPAEIYRHPADRWAASFVGEANVLTGRVATVGPAATADTVLGRLPLVASISEPRITDLRFGEPGALLDVVVRPEQLRVRPGGDAVVELVEFHGHDATARVRLVEGTVVKVRAADIGVHRGDRVTVAFAGDAVSAFPSG